jgi:predicted MFS family arabinose efflux permease
VAARADGRVSAMQGALFGLGVLSLINLFNYLDRYIVAGVLPKIQQEFAVSHSTAGLLGSVFLVVYMLASPFTGYLGDRMPRKVLVAAAVLVWSLATAASGLATTFAALLIARAVIGIGEAGYATVGPAIIADLFPLDRRTRMLSLFYVAIPVGAAAGYAVGGAVGEAWGWRAAFFAGGLPGVLLAVAALFIREPPRGAMDGKAAQPDPVSFRDGLRQLSRNATFWTTTAGYTLMTFSIGGLSFWMPTFFEQERGMGAAQAGLMFGAVTAIAGLVGTLAGGVIGEWADRRRPGGGLWVSGIALIAAAPLMYLAADARSHGIAFALIFATQTLLFLNTGPINAAILNCVAPAFRAFAMGLNVLMIHMLGDAISPPLIGLVAEHFNLETAIKLDAAPVVLGGVMLMVAAGVGRRARRA